MKSINANLYRSDYYCRLPFTEPEDTVKKTTLHAVATSLYVVMEEVISNLKEIT